MNRCKYSIKIYVKKMKSFTEVRFQVFDSQLIGRTQHLKIHHSWISLQGVRMCVVEADIRLY